MILNEKEANLSYSWQPKVSTWKIWSIHEVMNEDPVFIMWIMNYPQLWIVLGGAESDGCNGARRVIVSSVLYLNSVENI